MGNSGVKNGTSENINKTAIKNFAVYSRNKLIKDIKNKAAMIGITEKGIQEPLSSSTGNIQLFDIGTQEPYRIEGKAIEQRNALVQELKNREKDSAYKTAYETLIEEVAYTWFNRIIAIRFMEVNNYMPNRMRVLSSGVRGINEPEFITNMFETSFEFSDEEKSRIIELKSNGSNLAMDELFQYLFIEQCNSLNSNLPELFEKTNDYTELLLTVSYNDVEGVIYKLVHDVPEADFDVNSENGNGQVEIIGWLYQYYNSERKDEVINVLRGKAIKKEDIPAATQLFTTDWVVRYMVDNSLGKYWLERNEHSDLVHSLEYLASKDIEKVKEKVSPEEIKFLDNCMGSGHILVYAFDVLMKIYEGEGYTTREAAKLIVENNLFGLEIDKRSYQLSYFAIMMKARQYNRRILDEDIQNNLYVFQDSTAIKQDHLHFLGTHLSNDERKLAIRSLNYLIELFKNAEELGSIIIVEGDLDIELLLKFVGDFDKEGQISFETIGIEETQQQLRNLIKIARLLKQEYEVVVTNPPYMNKFDKGLKKYVNDNYKDYSGDLFSVFIYRNTKLLIENGYSAYMSPFVWMFIKTYEKLREYIIETKHISTLIQMEYSAFEEATVPICSFVLQNNVLNQKGNYIKLSDLKGGMEVQRIKTLEAINNLDCSYIYKINQGNFRKIPGSPIAYWASKNTIDAFNNGNLLKNSVISSVGIQTGDNDKFLRFWWEIEYASIYFGATSKESTYQIKKWFPYNKGGEYRKWYGNDEIVIDWRNDGEAIKENSIKTGHHYQQYSDELKFQPMVTWSRISSGSPAFRLKGIGYLSDMAGFSLYSNSTNLNHIIAFCNSVVAKHYLSFLAPTLNFMVGQVVSMPYTVTQEDEVQINPIVLQNISLSKGDWDSFETSWNFIQHPLSRSCSTVAFAFSQWEAECNIRFNQLKANEKELNRIFINNYGLQNELVPGVEDKEVAIRKADMARDIRSLISYAVGCIFDRYSLDMEGQTLSGAEWTESKYSTFLYNKHNVIPLNDDKYFDDDIIELLCVWLNKVYGSNTLEENLNFIANALGGKGNTSREVIRNYFLKDFFNDHCRIYQKRPIYWLYDSGKQNGFKALVYMHRYDEDTTGKVRVDYLHQVQKSYERTIVNLQEDIANSKDAKESTQFQKRIEKLTKQLKECKEYDERLGHIALERIPIDLDDGVKVNYQKVQTDNKGKFHQILAKIK